MTNPEVRSSRPVSIWSRLWPRLAVVLALGLHVHLVTGNWSSRFLSGHEFRQAQTALSTLFIARDHDYGLAYPTPLFGPPWSIPMEFPLYQWTAAWISTHTPWSIVESSRGVSLACFYLTLPGLLLLLRELRPRACTARWLSLAILLCSPVYIFYTRAVLIEPMALMFSIWFLWAFSRMCRLASWSWAGVASVLGGIAALVKVTTFMAWCGFAAVGGLAWSWWQWRRGGWNAWRRSVGLGAVAALLPGVLSIWWLHFSDAVKAASPGGAWLQSDNLRGFNFGTWAIRTDPTGWAQTARHVFQAVVPAWGLLAITAGAIWLAWRRRERAPALALLWFVAVPMVFPLLYSYHDYYFYANAVAIAVAGGFVIAALETTAGWRKLTAPLALIVLCGGQMQSYLVAYQPAQAVVSSGGSHLTNIIRERLSPDSVLVVLGEDWSAANPFYAERRAFMIRNEMIAYPEALMDLLDCLQDEPIGALLVTNEQRSNTSLIHLVTDRLELVSRPSLSIGDQDLYLPRDLNGVLLFALLQDPNYRSLLTGSSTFAALSQLSIVADGSLQEIPTALAGSMFAIAEPQPHHYRAKFPLEVVNADDAVVLTAHPDSEIWFTTPSVATEVEIRFGMRPESYLQEQTRSDGVEFLVLGISTDGRQTTLYHRILDPVARAEDRGAQSHRFALPDPRPAQLVFATAPHHAYSFDWAYWQKILIH